MYYTIITEEKTVNFPLQRLPCDALGAHASNAPAQDSTNMLQAEKPAAEAGTQFVR
jgi:hypothetical protein